VTTEDYAQHFTPLPAVDLAYDLIDALYSPLHAPRLIDPACGEGAFLFRAIERGLAPPASTFGIERDPALACEVFGHKAGPRAAVADALSGLTAPGAPGAFDLVVANPPYGTGGAGLRQVSANDARRLAASYELWAIPRASRRRVTPERLRSYPAEVLFLELCLSLARPGGHVVILLPEGVVANTRYASVREWLLAHTQIDAVVGLPKSTFRRTGAAAKTVLLCLTRRHPRAGHRILLGEVGEWPSSVVGAASAAMPLLDFRTERLQSDPRLARRLDPSYWHPSYDELLGACRVPLLPLGEFISDLTYGPIVTGRELPNVRGGVSLVNQGQVGFCGVDLTDAPHAPLDSPWVSARSVLRPGDIVLPRSGEGSLGKHRVAVFLADQTAGVGSFVDLIRLQGLNPFYLAAFLKSRLGRAQVSRVANGVGVPNISFDEIRSLLVPALPPEAQQTVERRYRREVLPLHHQAVSRHAALRATGAPPKQDEAYQSAREAGERNWRRVIGDLDRAVGLSS
jgi:hypothetical protein